MKLDMNAINKLNPPGLLYLEALARLIQRLIAGLDVHGPATGASLKYARMIGRLTRQYREGLNFNQNMRIKMWVLACAQRRAWVRSVIGEATIKRWQQKYDILSGVAPHTEMPARKPAANSNLINNQNKARKPAEPKQFALPNLSDMFFKPISAIPDIYVPEPLTRIAPLFQPRPAPDPKPVEFSPHELSPDYVPTETKKPRKDTHKDIRAPEPLPLQNKRSAPENDENAEGEHDHMPEEYKPP